MNLEGGGHRPDGLSSSEGPGDGWDNSRELAGVTPHVRSVQLGRRPLSMCSSNLEEVLRGSMAGGKFRPARTERKGNGVQPPLSTEQGSC